MAGGEGVEGSELVRGLWVFSRSCYEREGFRVRSEVIEVSMGTMRTTVCETEAVCVIQRNQTDCYVVISCDLCGERWTSGSRHGFQARQGTTGR